MKTTMRHEAVPEPGSRTYVHTLVTQHRSALIAYAETLLADRYLAEDIVQEAFIRIWHHAEKVRAGEGSVRGWLLKVTRNLVIDQTRSAYVRHETATDETWDIRQPDHADAVLASVEAGALLRCLSPEHRKVLVHTYLVGHTIQETAHLLGIPAGTVKSRRHYALRVLRSRTGNPSASGPGSGKLAPACPHRPAQASTPDRPDHFGDS
ncbi:sigma-70 family RNA polymerase sigma factor [Streptomyces sp. NPDC020362]|uniref:sigma-70 family RNA polymerase sigma factor n=1 Tax=unclassified Streptomyces TaxID=2593676 RepID=UPI000AF67E77